MLSTMMSQPLTVPSIIRFPDASGQPAVSVPLYQSKAGLPIGIQCVAKFGDEATLIRLALQFEQVLPWVQRRPLLRVMEVS